MTLEFAQQDNRESFTLKTKWTELNAREFVRLTLAMSGRYLPVIHRGMLMALGVKRKYVNRMSHSQLAEVRVETNFTWEELSFPDWKIRPHWFLRQPAQGLQHTTTLQFALADQYLRAFLKDDDGIKHLSALFFSLHHPRSIRWTRNWHRIAKPFGWLISKRRKVATAYNFLAISNWYETHFPAAHKKISGPKGKDYGWPGMITRIAGERFGPVRETERTPIYAVMIYLEDNAEERIRLQRQRLKAKRKR